MLTLQLKIYVVCLAAYHAGKLHGEWIDANQDVTSLEQAIQKILASSPVPNAEVWAIHDKDDFVGITLSEYESLESISEVAACIAEQGELGAALVDNFNNDVERAKRKMEEDYYGAYASEKGFAYEVFNESIRLIGKTSLTI